MSTIDRILYSKEHSFIAFRTHAVVASTLTTLTAITVWVLPQIVG